MTTVEAGSAHTGEANEPMGMRVLLMESEPWAADEAQCRLELAGHTVERCFERNIPTLPCFGLRGGATCPLASGALDVRLVVRSDGWRDHPTTLERGAGCVAAADVPLVVAGVLDGNPYRASETVAVKGTDHVVEACVLAVAI